MEARVVSLEQDNALLKKENELNDDLQERYDLLERSNDEHIKVCTGLRVQLKIEKDKKNR